MTLREQVTVGRAALLAAVVSSLCLRPCQAQPWGSQPQAGDARRASGTPRYETTYVAHVMPWYDDSMKIHGSHWCDPAFGGSYYESVFGLYSSADPTVIRKQLLLMKAAGIDGVWIDLQFKEWVEAVQAIIDMAGDLDMRFAVVIDNYARASIVEDTKEHLKAWMELPHYYRVFGRPVLPYFEHEKRWGMTQLPDWRTHDGHQPYVIGTYMVHEDGLLPPGYDSLFFWNSPDARWQQSYYESPHFSFKVGSIYRGWWEAYTDRHHNAPYLGFLNRTLQLAKEYEPYFAQVVTWNDYTEGTMLEPAFLRDRTRGGCADPKESFWQSTSKSCGELFGKPVFGANGTLKPCLAALAPPGDAELPCSGSGISPCANVTDCSKPVAAREGPPHADCPGGDRSAFAELALIATAVTGLPFQNATVLLEKIADGWEPPDLLPPVPTSDAEGLGSARTLLCISAAFAALLVGK